MGSKVRVLQGYCPNSQCGRQNVLGDGSGQAPGQNRQNFGQNRQSFFFNGSVLGSICLTCLSRLSKTENNNKRWLLKQRINVKALRGA